MRYNKLADTDLHVSELCLGTMTFGQQNTEADGHEQITYSIANGINFIDTAELYAVPSSPATQGLTEKFIGTWLAKNKSKRSQIIIGTKAVGPSANLSYIADNLGFSKERLEDAVTKSLKRLQTDYIDLYQLHWPERSTNRFGIRNYKHDNEWIDNFSEILESLNDLKKRGLIRHYGVSNETPWGCMNFVRHAERLKLEKPVSIQNAYSLVNRTFEVGLSEVSLREDIGLLAYSPLGMGILTGKYHDGSNGSQYRLNRFGDRLPRYNGSNTFEASKKYIEIAKKYNLSPSKMALAFVRTKPFVKSVIFGATSMEQLKSNISSLDVDITPEIHREIEEVHAENPNPST